VLRRNLPFIDVFRQSETAREPTVGTFNAVVLLVLFFKPPFTFDQAGCN
jgi:hypothetical protein